MKLGQTEVVTAILISGIVMGMVGSVYFWGFPLIQKSRGTNVIENCESLMFLIDQKIKSVSSTGGRENVKLTCPGLLKFNNEKLLYDFSTEGTIYATNAKIPLGRTKDCESDNAGVFGEDDPSVFCVISYQLDERKYDNEYSLTYRDLKTGLKTYRISLQGPDSEGGLDHMLVIQNEGVDEAQSQGSHTITIKIGISIQ